MTAPFRLYNTRSRQVEAFQPLTPGEIKLYVCGNTVYDHAHVGHARAMMVFDTFVRWLRHEGWRVTFVRNFTDVDDKIIRRANAEGVPAEAIAERFIASYHADCDGLGLLRPDHEPRVSTSMDAIRAMIDDLLRDGHAYVAGGSVWFRVRSFPSYGALSGQDIEAMSHGGDAEPGKADPRDFALWKAAKEGEPSWPSPWGPGRPGWHIECSAMNRATLGETIDIHGGGLDLVFPHHENEVAQSECANHAPYARWWMHNGLLTLVQKTESGNVLAAKMGKSLGNAFHLHDALAQFPAEALRMFYLQGHYRSPLPWSDTSLVEALAMLARLMEATEVGLALPGDGDPDAVADQVGPEATGLLTLARAFPTALQAALRDDFNTAAALGLAFELARALNRFANLKAAKKRGGPVARVAVQALYALQPLGLLQSSPEAFQAEVKRKRLAALGLTAEAIEAMVAERLDARRAQDWARADALRDALAARSIIVMDRADGGCEWRVRLTA
ncbi:MAG: cysteinyl-tRNA synthetase [Pseudomonadota bacterium]